MKLRQQALAAIALLFAASTPAWAIYKCDDGTGKQIFQDRPCTTGKSASIEVRPASGHAPKEEPVRAAKDQHSGNPLTGTTKPMTEAQRLNEPADQISNLSRLKDINDLYLGGAYERTRRVQSSCNREMDALANKKRFSANNLAGATWEQSISAEMQAVAASCQAEQLAAQNDLDRIIKEKAQLEKDLSQ